MASPDRTPIIVGVGQFTERIDSANFEGLSPIKVAARAAAAALGDASSSRIGDNIDVIATTRCFEDSAFGPAPFGKSNNYPRSIARQLGITPRRALWGKAGGNAPQQLVNEFCERLADGDCEMVLLVGGEAISTARHLVSKGEKRDWQETLDDPVEDRGMGLKWMWTFNESKHQLGGAPQGYGLLENARRGQLKMSRSAYEQEMARLFMPFSQVAEQNPYSSAAHKAYSAEQLVENDDNNRPIADPYRRRLIARDQVNQGAAVLLTTVDKARSLGIPSSKWVYLHGYCDLRDRPITQRPDLGFSAIAGSAAQFALNAAGVSVGDVAHFDFYSCFPIAVFTVACDALGLSPDDPRKLTVTGGLPYFGGAGNNYSMHAIAEMVEKLRAAPGAFGLIGANGGFITKYSTGVYSTQPKTWSRCDSRPLQAQIDARPFPAYADEGDGLAEIETYTVDYVKGQPKIATVIGRLKADQRRFIAKSIDADQETIRKLIDNDPLGQTIYVRSFGYGNRFTFDEARMNALIPSKVVGLRDKYDYCLVERRGHLIEVTINRPEVRNSLNPQAAEELAEIFDAYERDAELWVAIITGAGTEAFSAGNDLKHTASGKPTWMPKSGFGGLTHRRRIKPVIAAVNGVAAGGGMEMLLACDIVIADENAQFALSEVRIGLIAGAGGVSRLPRQLPKKIAVELILTGRKLGAKEAMNYGFINRCVDPGKAMDGARELAQQILDNSPNSVRLSMQMMNEADECASELQAVLRPSEIFDTLCTSDDMFEGPMAFAQKRKPRWLTV